MAAPTSGRIVRRVSHNLDVHPNPADEYRDRLGHRRASHERLARTDRKFSNARLGVFGVGALALFLVWQQGREERIEQDGLGTFGFKRDFGGIFSTPSRSTFIVKMSYWFNR